MATLDPVYLVGTGGAVGALLRHAVDQRVDDSSFPGSAFAVNVLGSFALGLVTLAGMDGDALLLVGTGVCGAFTTFSTFSFETVRLWEAGEPARAATNAVGTLLGAGVALGAAWLVASKLP